MKECINCGFYDENYGCACPSYDMWYACPIESERPENIKAIKDYAESKEEERRKLSRENYARQLNMLGYEVDGNPKK